MQKWDYLQDLGPADLDAVGRVCAERGADGWELCGMMNVSLKTGPQLDDRGLIVGQGAHMPGVALVFKRLTAEVSPAAEVSLDAPAAQTPVPAEAVPAAE